VSLVYGGSVSALTRYVASSSYANFQRALGDSSGLTGTAQNAAEAWNADSNDVTRLPIGLWMTGANWADVSDPNTLNEKAQGDLALSGQLVPSYTVTLTPGVYTWGSPRLGDTVPLIVQRGRLDVNTTVRVVGIAYAIGDDGQEDVTLTLGRPAAAFSELLTRPTRDVNAIVRR
jgi:hypothetical protein